MKTYYIIAWVHPEEGGDDEQYELSINAKTTRKAQDIVESWLKSKASCDLTDYSFETERQRAYRNKTSVDYLADVDVQVKIKRTF